MSSVLSIPDVVDSTIRNALKQSSVAGPSGNATGGARSGKMQGVLKYAKSHTFTLIGVIAVGLVIAVGVYMAMQHYKKSKKALNTDDEALNRNDFEMEEGEEEEEQEDEDYVDVEDAGVAERKPLVNRAVSDKPRAPVDDPNWTPLELLTSPNDE